MRHIISLGAGVQSSTMALMAAHGDITPMPECAIFADTQSEPRKVYEWLTWLETKLPFPVHRVTKGSLRDNLLQQTGERFVSIPSFTDFNGEAGMTRRQCSREFKIEVIQKKVRGLLGLAYRQRAPKEVVVTQWIGISWDERQRMKENDLAYVRSRWPLVEQSMTRGHCIDWMARHGYPTPPKSACTFCPYHDDALWMDMKANDPESFADAVRVDRGLRDAGADVARGMTARQYLHRSLVPLDQVEFHPDDKQAAFAFGMGNECEGVCGV